MVEYLPEIDAHFSSNHIKLKRDWLQEALHYVSSMGKSRDQLADLVYHQWLFADLQTSTEPVRGLKRVADSTACFLKEPSIFQVQSVRDIGMANLKQYKRLTDPSYEEPTEFDFQPNPNRPNANSHSCLCLQLSDGTVELKAFEKKRVPALSMATCPGSKILVYSPAELRNGHLFLTTSNCQPLGGAVEGLMRQNDATRKLCERLGRPMPTTEAREHRVAKVAQPPQPQIAHRALPPAQPQRQPLSTEAQERRVSVVAQPAPQPQIAYRTPPQRQQQRQSSTFAEAQECQVVAVVKPQQSAYRTPPQQQQRQSSSAEAQERRGSVVAQPPPKPQIAYRTPPPQQPQQRQPIPVVHSPAELCTDDHLFLTSFNCQPMGGAIEKQQQQKDQNTPPPPPLLQQNSSLQQPQGTKRKANDDPANIVGGSKDMRTDHDRCSSRFDMIEQRLDTIENNIASIQNKMNRGFGQIVNLLRSSLMTNHQQQPGRMRSEQGAEINGDNAAGWRKDGSMN